MTWTIVALLLGVSCGGSVGGAGRPDGAGGPHVDSAELCSVFTTRAGPSFSYAEHLAEDPPFTEAQAGGAAAEAYLATAAGHDPGEGAPLAKYLADLIAARADDDRAVGPERTDEIRRSAEIVDRIRASGACASTKPFGEP